MAGGPSAPRERQDVHSIAPLKLLSPRRLDLVCKYLYFRELISSDVDKERDGSLASQLYEKHIRKRTGGVEPPDRYHSMPTAVDKRSVADYVRHAQTLLASLRENGFDPNAAVTYFADGTLGNGAHRISAALALDIPVFARREQGHGTAWPFKWFVENGFTSDELQTLLYFYTRLKLEDVAVFVFYSPARQYWDLFAETIGKTLHIVGQLEIAVDSPVAMYEVIHDLYGTLEPLSSTGIINRKALLLAMTHPLTFRVVVGERMAGAEDVYRVAAAAKNACRQLARDIVAPESYLAVHAGSSSAETLTLAGVLLSSNGLRQLRRRRAAGSRTEFLGWLAECRRTCEQSDIALNDICIVGSSPLEVLGVRPSTDVDFTLKSHYRRSRYGKGVSHLTPVVDIVTAGYHRSRERPAISDDELIDNPALHFIFRGLKFANPEIVLEHKDFYRRDKDVRDVESTRRFLAAGESSSFDPAFEYAACTEVLLRELSETRTAVSTPTPTGGRWHVLRRSRNYLGRPVPMIARARRTAGALIRRLRRGP
jgi:hypothetical protein